MKARWIAGSLALALALVPVTTGADTPAKPAPAKKEAPPPKETPPKPVKSATRAELEMEVEALRAENKKLKAELETVLTREKDRIKRLQEQIGQMNTTLK